MNVILDNLFARRPKIHYVCPPICGVQFVPTSSGSSSPSFEPVVAPALPCVHYFLTVRGLEWSEYSEAICYNVYQAVFGSTTFIPILDCAVKQIVPVEEGSCYIVTAVTANGESPFCIEAMVCPGVTPPIPVPPTECVNFYLTDITPVSANFTWDAVLGATGYNVYAAPSADPLNFSLLHGNVAEPTVFPIDCQRIKVSALNSVGEGPICEPAIEFCYTPPIGACGTLIFNPAVLSPAAWWKADSYLPMADASYVGGPGLEWTDQSGSGRDAVTGSVGAFYRSPDLFFPGSGLPSVQFGNGAGDLDFPVLNVGAGDFTFVFLYAANVGGPLNIFLGQVGTGFTADTIAYAVHGGYAINDANCGSFTTPVDACANGGIGSGHPNVAIFQRSGGVLYFWNNSTKLGSVASVCTFSGFTRLGAYVSGVSSARLEGNFAEVFLFNSALSDSTIVSLVEGYLRPKWCLTDCVP